MRNPFFPLEMNEDLIFWKMDQKSSDQTYTVCLHLETWRGRYIWLWKWLPGEGGQLSRTHFENLNFETFDYAEHKTYDPKRHFDPDNHFYNNNNSCEYYTDDQLYMNIKMDNTLLIIHFNSRSLYKNFYKIKEYLSKLHKFNIIVTSETRLDNDKVSDIGLEGYELFTMNRVNKKGGGLPYMWTELWDAAGLNVCHAL